MCVSSSVLELACKLSFVITHIYVYRDAAERDLAAAEKAVKQLELAAPKAAQLAAAKREEAADLEARLGQLQVGPGLLASRPSSTNDVRDVKTDRTAIFACAV